MATIYEKCNTLENKYVLANSTKTIYIFFFTVGWQNADLPAHSIVTTT